MNPIETLPFSALQAASTDMLQLLHRALVQELATRGGPAVTKLHFDSTGQAYGATQTQDWVRNGTVLVIPNERVIGVAHTWPVAVTEAAGELHKLDPALGELSLAELEQTLGYPLQPAIDEALSRGYPLCPVISQSVRQA